MTPLANFTEALKSAQALICKGLLKYLPDSSAHPVRLNKAMHYVTLNGGKRIRPLLVFASAQTFGLSWEEVLPAAVAIELIHVYSMVHDDLPAMDDDDLRRGKPTCHKAFDEATAILVGDGLQALAFELLAQQDLGVDPVSQLKMVQCLAQGAGPSGMVKGQALDIDATGQHIDLPALEHMHRHKTGALIHSAVQLGAIFARATTEQLNVLTQYSACIGLNFQIQDDILDVEGTTLTLGKTVGMDQKLQKATYPSLMGLPQAKEKAQSLHLLALDYLGQFDEKADLLREISEFIIKRTQ